MCLLVFVVLNLFLLSFFLDFVILLQLKALEVETGPGGGEGGFLPLPHLPKEVRGGKGFSLGSPDLGCQRTGLLWGGSLGSA